MSRRGGRKLTAPVRPGECSQTPKRGICYAMTIRNFLFLFCFFGVFFLRQTFAVDNHMVDPKESKNSIKKNDAPKIANGFEFKLDIENGHIGHVYIGCHHDATDAFDNKLDDMAPPAGMGPVGFTCLVSPDRKYNLYKDIRAFADTVQWLLYVKPKRNPVIVSWNPELIPSEWNLFFSPWDGTSEKVDAIFDCRKELTLKTDKTGFIRFWTVRNHVDENKTVNEMP